MSRLGWALPSPPTQWVLPGDASQRRDVIDAVEDYSLWDPGHQAYAIGQMSVRVQFEAQLADPRARVHH